MACKLTVWKRERAMAASNREQNPTTPASTELQKKLADMKAEREKLDTLWTAPVTTPVQQQMTYDDSDKNPLLQTQKPAFFQASKKNVSETYATWG